MTAILAVMNTSEAAVKIRSGKEFRAMQELNP